MAEPKDDPDAPHFVHKISNHIGNSRLEESLNDFLELHSEELRTELSRADSPPVSGRERATGGLKPAGTYGQELDLGETAERWKGEREQEPGFDNGGFSHRVHSIYQEFLAVVQGNLEEFLEAEGLTEAQLRDACEQEMQAKDPGGLSFMHTLISSWEFSSFIALVSGFLDEGSGSEEDEDEDEEDEEEDEEEEEEEEEENVEGGGEGGDASPSSAGCNYHGGKGAESLSFDERSRRCRCPPRASSSSSSSSSSTSSCRRGRARAPRLPSSSVVAGLVVVADDSFAAEKGQKETPLFAPTTCSCGLESVTQKGDGDATAVAGVAATGEFDGRRENTRGERSGATAAAGFRERSGGSGDPPETEALFLEARGAVDFNARGQRRGVLELPTRAEAKS